MLYIAIFVLGGIFGILTAAVISGFNAKPRIQTCSKHNYTGTDYCPDCRAMTPAWNLYIGEKEFDVDDMSYAYIAGARKMNGDFLKWIDYYRKEKQKKYEAQS